MRHRLTKCSMYGSRRTPNAIAKTKFRKRRSSLLLVRTSGTENEAAAHVGTLRDDDASFSVIVSLTSTRSEVLVGHEQMLILAGRVRRDRAKAEVVEALDQGALVLLLGRSASGIHVAVGRRADRTEAGATGATGALATAGTGTGGAVDAAAGSGTGTVHAATVKLMAGQRGRVEVR